MPLNLSLNLNLGFSKRVYICTITLRGRVHNLPEGTFEMCGLDRRRFYSILSIRKDNCPVNVSGLEINIRLGLDFRFVDHRRADASGRLFIISVKKLTAFGKAAPVTDQAPLFVRQDIATFRADTLHAFGRARCHTTDNFKNLGHGIGTGKDHFSVLPDGGWAADTFQLFNHGIHPDTGPECQGNQASGGFYL